jgi:hypothetical protein
VEVHHPRCPLSPPAASPAPPRCPWPAGCVISVNSACWLLVGQPHVNIDGSLRTGGAEQVMFQSTQVYLMHMHYTGASSNPCV